LEIERRFSGLERLYGVTQAHRVMASHVVVVGIGGVGSWAAEALARSGVGRITLIDMDHIAESNVNRQVHALTPTIGQSKVLAMQERIALINAACVVQGVDDFVTPDNWPEIVPADVDAVLDACDQVRAKTAMAQWARCGRVPFITVGAAGGKRHAHRVEIADLSETTHDPLLAQLRYRLRKFHGAPARAGTLDIACVFSREAVAQPDASCAVQLDQTLNCHGYGSVVTVTATFGLCAAGWVMDKISARQPVSQSNNAIL